MLCCTAWKLPRSSLPIARTRPRLTLLTDCTGQWSLMHSFGVETPKLLTMKFGVKTLESRYRTVVWNMLGYEVAIHTASALWSTASKYLYRRFISVAMWTYGPQQSPTHDVAYTLAWGPPSRHLPEPSGLRMPPGSVEIRILIHDRPDTISSRRS